MFLVALNEKEKSLFLDLCIHVSSSDDDFCELEKIMIGLLCEEMNIAKRFIAEKSVQEALDFFATHSSVRTRRIVYFELYGIVLADGVFADSERAFMDDLVHRFALGDAFISSMEVLVQQFFADAKKISRLIEGKL